MVLPVLEGAHLEGDLVKLPKHLLVDSALVRAERLDCGGYGLLILNVLATCHQGIINLYKDILNATVRPCLVSSQPIVNDGTQRAFQCAGCADF